MNPTPRTFHVVLKNLIKSTDKQLKCTFRIVVQFFFVLVFCVTVQLVNKINSEVQKYQVSCI